MPIKLSIQKVKLSNSSNYENKWKEFWRKKMELLTSVFTKKMVIAEETNLNHSLNLNINIII